MPQTLSDHGWNKYDIPSTLPTDCGQGMWRPNNKILPETYHLFEKQLSFYSADYYNLCKENLGHSKR